VDELGAVQDLVLYNNDDGHGLVKPRVLELWDADGP
jgi:hypothetical protein